MRQRTVLREPSRASDDNQRQAEVVSALPVVRKLGVRTREINRQKYALKALRGDFDHVSPERPFDQEDR